MQFIPIRKGIYPSFLLILYFERDYQSRKDYEEIFSTRCFRHHICCRDIILHPIRRVGFNAYGNRLRNNMYV